MAKKAENAAAASVNTPDVDDFLNDTAPVEEVIDTTNLDLSQIPPPEPIQNPVLTNTKKSTVEGPKLKGELRKFSFSRFGPNKRPITTDLSDQMLPPITKRHTAIYQLLGLQEGASTDKRIQSQESERANIVDTSDYEMHATYSIFDQFEKDFGRQTKVVTYYDGVQRTTYKDPITGEMRPEIRQKVGTPRFSRGQAVVDIMRNYHQYLWWELHPGNKTNKFRDKSKPALFERIDLKHYNPHMDMIRKELEFDAMKYIRGLQAGQVIDLATALDIPVVGVQPSALKTDLYTLAQKDPEKVLFKAPDEIMSTTIEIMRAVDLGILDYDALRKQYFFAQNINEPLFVVPMDEIPYEALAKYLVGTEEGQIVKEKMMEFIYYWI
jgi:hypothetical protein